MQRINAYVHQMKIASYIINLDPAVYEVPYEANIDIRDTVNYKNVMKQFGLGPNGGILTSLNLFSTKFHDVIGLIHKRESSLKYVFIDTPGQIEVFTWSASGQIITETLAATYPTMLIYVIDTVKCIDYTTFMSNMTYACSILYKTKLPFLIVFNKIDVQNHEFALEWMKNSDSFEKSINNDKMKKQTYMTSLTKSLSQVLDVFYKNINTVGVSAVTGQGMKNLFQQLTVCRKEYFGKCVKKPCFCFFFFFSYRKLICICNFVFVFVFVVVVVLDDYEPMLKAKYEERQKQNAKKLSKKIAKIEQEVDENETVNQMLNKSNYKGKNKKNSKIKNIKEEKSDSGVNYDLKPIFQASKDGDTTTNENDLIPDGDEIIQMTDDSDDDDDDNNGNNGNNNDNDNGKDGNSKQMNDASSNNDSVKHQDAVQKNHKQQEQELLDYLNSSS